MRPLALAACLLLAGPALALPDFEAVRAAHRPSDLTLLDRHGVPLQSLRVDATVRRGAWMALHEMSPALRTAIVLGEDRRFWQHAGVDWAGLAAAAWANAWNERTRGASTLTMQLAGLLDDEHARPAGGRSVWQKIGQAGAASALERRWQKTQILEAYLNLVPLRGDAVGVPAASWQLFAKAPGGLDAVEAAILAVLVRSPNAAAADVQRRACTLLRQQRRDCGGLARQLAQALARQPAGLGGPALAPHFARAWQAAGGGARTTIDAALQRRAVQALRRQLSELRGRNVEDGAVVVFDNASGEVLAWVGSSGPLSSAAAVDAVLARRQPGSTLKPFVYALAFERRLLTAASLLDDSPLQLAAGGGLYAPQNYDGGFKGTVPARVALASSLNVPAVRVASMLGTDAVFDALQQAGLSLRENAGFHGLSLALGSAEVTLLDLANAYRALARGGWWTPPAWPQAGAAPRRLFDPRVAWLVADILADPAARALGFGFDSPLVTRGFAAVKTGTSKDLRDNWCLGFTSRYTVGVWVGNAGGAPMHGVSGVAGAAPVWREVVGALHAGDPSRPPPVPAGLQQLRGERFLDGTLPWRGDGEAGVAGAAAFGIGAPSDGSVIVVDPDIPLAHQRLHIEGAPGRWWMDGREIGRGARLSWPLQPGRHRLERRDAAGGVADRVDFEVRLSGRRG